MRALISSHPKDVIRKAELYAPVFERKCCASTDCSERSSTDGVSGLGMAGNKTFPPLQQMPGGSFFHVGASQCLHSMFILPMLLGVGFSVRYLIETFSKRRQHAR